jgi:DNA-binding MarR family transcriptional regulator
VRSNDGFVYNGSLGNAPRMPCCVPAATAEIGRKAFYPSQERLAKATSVSKLAISRSLARLERGRFVRRHVSGCDKRVRRSRITAAGFDLLARCDRDFGVLRNEMFGFTQPY